jgi:hypothetical protein
VLDPCDSTSLDRPCPATSTGRPRTCFAASQLSGQDFCTETCDPASSDPVPDGYQCLGSGALLRVCAPSAGPDAGLACPPGLSCYRTDVLGDWGLCIWMPVCASDTDCPQTTHCVGQILRGLITNPIASEVIQTDHLNCVVAQCQSLGTACPNSEGCLAKPYFTGGLGDFCVPKCDSQLQCPPNFSCAVNASGPGSPPLCFPGAPGVRCTGDAGCAGVACQDTGAGFKVCTIHCQSDSDCTILNATSNSFVCVDGGGSSHCVTPSPFSAPNCDPRATAPGCPPDRQCYQYSPLGPFPGHLGECRFPCDSSGHCAAFGGLAHTCLEGGDGGCYPAVFGVPCQSQCIADFRCLTVPGEASDAGDAGSTICTIPCNVDADCDNDPWTNHSGYCANGGFCRLGRPTGEPCDRNAECLSRVCDSANRACLDAP